jgi:hypothetical protein
VTPEQRDLLQRQLDFHKGTDYADALRSAIELYNRVSDLGGEAGGLDLVGSIVHRDREIERLRAIVDKLPVTADGVGPHDHDHLEDE